MKDHQLYLAMEYCNGGDLDVFIKKQGGTPLDEQVILKLTVQIAIALEVNLTVMWNNEQVTGNIVSMKQSSKESLTGM